MADPIAPTPAPIEPALTPPVEPVEPAPVEPAPIEPAPVEPSPALTPPTGGDYSEALKDIDFTLPDDFEIGGSKVEGGVIDLVKHLDERNAGLRKVLSEKGYTAPEKYDYTGMEGISETASDEELGALSEVFKAAKMTQEQAQEIVPLIQGLAQGFAEANSKVTLQDTWNLTGEKYEAHLGSINTWAHTNLSDAEFADLQKQGVRGILTAEAYMKAKMEPSIWKGGKASDTVISEAEVKGLQMSDAYKDPNHADHEKVLAQVRAYYVATTPAE